MKLAFLIIAFFALVIMGWAIRTPIIPNEWGSVKIGMTRREVLNTLNIEIKTSRMCNPERIYTESNPLYYLWELKLEIKFENTNNHNNYSDWLNNKSTGISISRWFEFTEWWGRVKKTLG